MRTSLSIALFVLLGTQTFAQPYAPEYLEQLPAYFAPPGVDVPAPKPEVTP